MNQYQEVVELISGLIGNEYLYFDQELRVQLTPHRPAFIAWAVSVSSANEIYLMDADEHWEKLQMQDCNYEQVMNTLYQRVKLISAQYRQVS